MEDGTESNGAAAAGVVSSPVGAAESGAEVPSSSPDSFSEGGPSGEEAAFDLEAYVSEVAPHHIGYGFSERAEGAFAYAREFESQHSRLADALGKAAENDPALHAALTDYLFSQGDRVVPNRGGKKLDALKSEPRGRQALQDAIDDIMAKHPPGTLGYTAPQVQRQLADLHRRLHGDEPIVGGRGETHLRTV